MAERVVDTNVVSFLIKGHALGEAYSRMLHGHTLMLSFSSVAELYEGAFGARWGPRKMRMLEATLAGYAIVGSSLELCRLWGAIRTERRRRPIAPDDAWIAATALLYNLPLVTHNPKDFRGITGLSVITVQPS